MINTTWQEGCIVLQTDIQKILRNARKLPEKQQNFYKVSAPRVSTLCQHPVSAPHVNTLLMISRCQFIYTSIFRCQYINDISWKYKHVDIGHQMKLPVPSKKVILDIDFLRFNITNLSRWILMSVTPHDSTLHMTPHTTWLTLHMTPPFTWLHTPHDSTFHRPHDSTVHMTPQ